MENESEKNPILDSKNEEIKKPSKIKEIFKELLTFIIIAVVIVLPFRVYIAEPYLVDGRSMDPTFSTGDYLIVDKLTYRRSLPKRNTVVVFKYPGNPSKSFIKRIIGLPGETVIEKDNSITIINPEYPKGFTIDQSYVVDKNKSPSNFSVTLSPDEYFVMGDNRAESFDSRSWGPLNKKYILGKPILRLLPISEIGVLPGNDDK